MKHLERSPNDLLSESSCFGGAGKPFSKYNEWNDKNWLFFMTFGGCSPADWRGGCRIRIIIFTKLLEWSLVLLNGSGCFGGAEGAIFQVNEWNSRNFDFFFYQFLKDISPQIGGGCGLQNFFCVELLKLSPDDLLIGLDCFIEAGGAILSRMGKTVGIARFLWCSVGVSPWIEG